MMNFASQDLNEWRESTNYYEISSPSSATKPKIKIDSVKLLADKLRIPDVVETVVRPRLTTHLEKSLAQYSATLITGRAGTGKTDLAVNCARQSDFCVAWYKVETADSDWKIFSSYLLGSISQNCSENFEELASNEIRVPLMTESLAERFADAAKEKPLLIVLDDLHSIFDADWFTEFFTSFVSSLAPNVHLLMIARTEPPLPLWRLRSKQVLGVMDEKLLSFTLDETVELFRKHRLSAAAARSAHKLAYGKVAKLTEIIEKKSAKPNRIFV
jgi:LuxR family maltose regulon positive regulatory protein